MLKKHNPIILHRILDTTDKNIESKDPMFEDISYKSFRTIISTANICRSVVEASSLDTMSKNQPGIILTFDDGNKSDIRLALPLIQEANFAATFFIVPEFIGQNSFMNWSDVRSLIEAGMEVGSHSMSHPDFRKLNYDQAHFELLSSKKIIEEKVSTTVKSFSFPFGFAPPKYVKLAKALGYLHIMGSQHGVIGTFDRNLLPRNSIHSHMSESQIIATLSASKSLKIAWKIEDSVKPILKKLLPKPTYSIIKKLVAGKIRNF